MNSAGMGSRLQFCPSIRSAWAALWPATARETTLADVGSEWQAMAWTVRMVDKYLANDLGAKAPRPFSSAIFRKMVAASAGSARRCRSREYVAKARQRDM